MPVDSNGYDAGATRRAATWAEAMAFTHSDAGGDNERANYAAAVLRYVAEWDSNEQMGRTISFTAHEFLDGLRVRLESEARTRAVAGSVTPDGDYDYDWSR